MLGIESDDGQTFTIFTDLGEVTVSRSDIEGFASQCIVLLEITKEREIVPVDDEF